MRHLKLPSVSAFVLLLAAPLLAGGATGDESAEAPRLVLEPCRLPGLDEEVRCGTYEVFADRAAKSGPKIPLKVVVLPAKATDPDPNPLVFFAGGPGDSATTAAAGIAYEFASLRSQRDVLLVDVRGTGGSDPLFCPHQEKDRGVEDALETFIPVDKVDDCRDHLDDTHDLSLYTTPILIDDVDEVRAALGYEKVNLIGGSYGSRAVLVYLRRHPEVVRTAVIEGVAPTDSKIPLTFARDAQNALDALFAECAGDDACHAAFPDPAAELAMVLARLDEEPVEVEVYDAKGGAAKTLRVSRPVFVQALRYMLYQPLAALQVPAYVHAAAAGDFTAIAQTAYNFAGALMTAIPDGLYLAVTCTEDVPFIDPKAATAAHQGTFLGDFRYRQQRDACDAWGVRGALPEGYHQPVNADVPVLVVSGERDPVTPARWGDEVARHLPRSRHLVVPDAAHSNFGLPGAECVQRLVVDFVASGKLEGLDLESCRAAVRRPPFLLDATVEKEVELDEAALGRVVGSYSNEEGLVLEVVVEDGRPRAKILEEDLLLVPVSALRFRIEGAPPGTYLLFVENGDDVRSVDLFQSGVKVLSLGRRE